MRTFATRMRPQVQFQWINNHTYAEVWDFQTRIQQQMIEHKRSIAQEPMVDGSGCRNVHHLLFCEHAPVYTLGKSGKREHLLVSDDALNNGSFEFFKINRGGDITYHGPGQITGYPIFDLECFFTDIHKYVRYLEEAVIIWLEQYGLKGVRIPEYTGVWLAPDSLSPNYRKICAIGVHVSRWVTMHGFALNINTELQDFERIVPCGIVDQDKEVTSLERETGKKYDLKEVGQALAEIMAGLFEFDIIAKNE
jgi:lipoyl(octanoyl) transferase